MAINTILNRIMSDRYGEDMRQDIHDGIKECYTHANVNVVGSDDTITMSYGEIDSDDDDEVDGNDMVDVLRQEISEALDEAKSYANSVTGGRMCYDSHYIIYVDGTVDENVFGEGTEESPYRTLDEAFLNANKRGDLRVRIVSPGLYEFTTQLLVNTNVHLRAMVDGVNLRGHFKEEEAWTCYTGRFKINAYDNDKTVTFLPPICDDVQNGDMGYKFESGGCHFRNVVFESCTVTFAQCWLFAKNLTARDMSLSNVSGTIDGLSITNINNDKRAIQIGNGSQLRIKGQLTVSSLDGTAGSNSVFLYVTDSDLVLSNSMSNNLASPYKYGLYLSSTEITMTKDRWNSWRDNCTAQKIVVVSSCDISITNGATPNFVLGDGITIPDSDWTQSL